MECHERGEILSAYLDNELGLQEHSRVQAHLTTCVMCRTRFERFQAIKNMAVSVERHTIPLDIIQQLADTLEQPVPLEHKWLPLLRKLFSLPKAWVPIGAVAAATVSLLIWLGAIKGQRADEIPLETLLAAHSRYQSESLITEGDMSHSNFSEQLAVYYDKGTK